MTRGEDFFGGNMAALERRFPGFEKQMREAAGERKSGSSADVLFIETSRSGAATALVEGRYIHSRFDPVKEAARLVEKEIPERTGLVLFEGFGMGYHVEAFLKRPGPAAALVFEPSAARFLNALSARPMEELLSSERLNLVVGARPEAIGPVLATLAADKPLTMRLRPLYEADPEGFLPYDEAIRHFYSRKEVNNATLDRFAETWNRNLIRNMEAMAGAGDVAMLKDRFRGMPALILAAGPTLDPLLDHFDEIRNKAVVIAVDTACRALTLRGVKPDILAVVDPQYWNTRHLDNADLSDTVLVSESSTHPVIFRRDVKRLLFCGSVFPLGIILESAVVRNAKLTAGGSVSTTAFSLAAYTGAGTIFTAGLDLGYPGGMTHFRGSFFEQRGHSMSGRFAPFEHFTHRILHEAGQCMIPSVGGEPVPSDTRLAVYRSWFAEQISRPGIPPVFALDPRSAAIEGVAEGSLRMLLDLPDIGEEKSRILNEIPLFGTEERERRMELLRQEQQNLEEELARLAEISEKAGRIAGDAAERAARGLPVQLQGELLEELDRRLLADASREVAGFLIQPFLRGFSSDMHDEAPAPEAGFRKSADLYDAIARAARLHLSFFRTLP